MGVAGGRPCGFDNNSIEKSEGKVRNRRHPHPGERRVRIESKRDITIKTPFPPTTGKNGKKRRENVRILYQQSGTSPYLYYILIPLS